MKTQRGISKSEPAIGMATVDPLDWFGQMIAHSKEHARAAQESGRPIVGIMCEYAPRELIMAAGAVPVCLCGGDAETIATAEQHLPATICPLIKSTYGYFLEKTNPFLEMADLVVAETTCDGKKKMFELMAEVRPTYMMALPQKENDPDAIEQWVGELRKLKSFLESRYAVEIDNGRLRSAIALMNRERGLRRELAGLMKSDTPPLTGRQLLELKSIISGQPADLEQYEAGLRLWKDQTAFRQQTTSSTAAEADDTGANGQCSPYLVSSRSPRARVLLTGVPLVHGAERVMELIEAHGGLVVCQENCTGLKPILEDVDPEAADPIRALAEKYFHLPCSVKTPNAGRIESLRRLAKEYRAECVIELVWQGCLTYLVESFRVKRLAEDDLNMPYLRIETDYSPSDSARIAVRVEALVEMVLNRRQSFAEPGA
jgi:benzoyl-CoA reductase/2-hydroxyglutaryl-CoA dehydratase subunit BcrC/BadD/HgdB